MVVGRLGARDRKFDFHLGRKIVAEHLECKAVVRVDKRQGELAGVVREIALGAEVELEFALVWHPRIVDFKRRRLRRRVEYRLGRARPCITPAGALETAAEAAWSSLRRLIPDPGAAGFFRRRPGLSPWPGRPGSGTREVERPASSASSAV